MSSQTLRLWVLVPVVLLLAVGGLVALAAGAASPAISAKSGAPLRLAGSGVHGDLVVAAGNSPYVISPATTGSGTYFQAGNISVLAGGKLVVQNTSIVFEEFIGNTGSAAQRLSHLYWISIKGSASFVGSTVTTDLNQINSYPKLSVNVSAGGSLSLVRSGFEFPGWVSASGVSTRFNMTQSALMPNPAATTSSPIGNTTILHDAMYSPSLWVGGGARAAIFESSVSSLYKNNLTQWGNPGADVYNSRFAQLSGGSPATWTGFNVPAPTAASLAIADAYPQVATADLILNYSANSTATARNGQTPNSFVYGSAFSLGTIQFPTTGGVDSTLVVPLSANAISAINAGGIPAFMQATGQFGSPATLQVNLNGTTPTPVNINSVSVVLNPQISYDFAVTGGSVVTAADSTLDVNWNLTAGTPVPPSVPAPMPWGSNKMTLSGGSIAYLANVSTTSPWTSDYLSTSAVVPDASSTANVYRWAAVRATGAAAAPVAGAVVQAFYAYDANQANNATASSLNDLATADPDLFGYAQSWYAARGISAPGVTDASGNGTLLLVSAVITQASLPNGQFLGGYHVSVSVPGVPSQWAYGSVLPYPEGMNPASPDSVANVNFPGYSAGVRVGAVSVLEGNASLANRTVAIGQALTLSVPVTDSGTAAISSGSVQLYWPEPAPFSNRSVGAAVPLAPLSPGHSETVKVSWVVNESVVGRVGPINATFAVGVVYNGGVAPSGGNLSVPVNVHIVPAYIGIQFNPPSGNLETGVLYTAGGSLAFAGNGSAIVNVTATGPSGTFLLSQVATPNGSFSADFELPQGMGSGAYALTVTAYYNHRTSALVLPNAITVGGAPTSTNPLTANVLGVPAWVLLAIAVGVVAAVLGAFFALGAMARGRLVECGECGELIPEKAPACPKCGAEFEPDLVRCSRCGSTIAAKSEVCPECAAQLLGNPSQEARDPERQGYADFVERYRVEARKELGENYGEGAFWDWWKRQSSYIPFGQWRLQQAASSRAGMSAPPPASGDSGSDLATEDVPSAPPSRSAANDRFPPPSGGAAPSGPAPPAGPARPAAVPPGARGQASTPSTSANGMIACASCAKEIPSDFLVCPFCGAVTR